MPNSTVAILRNPTSGSGAGRIQILRLIHELRRQHLRPRLFSKREGLRTWMSSNPQSRDLRAIVAAGGDGTVAEILNHYPDVPLAILPLGTENLLARYLKIPRCGAFVSRMIIASQLQQVDIGEINGRRFALMASVGFDAAVVHRTDGMRRGTISKLTYLLPILHLLRKYTYPEFRVYIDDDDVPLVARQAMLVNIPRYALGIQFARSAAIDDAQLDLRLFQHRTPFQMICDFYKVLAGTHEHSGNITCRTARRVRIEADSPVPVQVDGDPAGTTPVEVTIHAQACRVLVPPTD